MTDDLRIQLNNQITALVAAVDQNVAETAARFGDVFLQSAELSEEKRVTIFASFVEQIVQRNCYAAAEKVAGMFRDTASNALEGLRSVNLPKDSPELARAYPIMVFEQLETIAELGKLMADRFHDLRRV